MQAYPGHTYRDVLTMPLHAFVRLLQAVRGQQKLEQAAQDVQWMREQRELRKQAQEAHGLFI